MELLLLFALFSFCTFIVSLHFIFVLGNQKLLGKGSLHVCEAVTMLLYPLVFLGMFDFSQENDCCSDSAFFSPQHRVTAYTIIIFCELAYFYSSYRKTIAAPLLEVTLNSALLIGLAFNVFIAIHTNNPVLWGIGSIPIILLFLLQIMKNHQLAIHYFQESNMAYANRMEKIAWQVLALKPFQKIPILAMVCLPILFLLVVFLLLFGQKPDAAIRMFTDTYKHGLSQLDYMCDNVQCGGHYLCSVAAKGNKKIVKPIRLGSRGGNMIICNRQLLVSNAFEELMEERFPQLHKCIRRQYNKVGNVVHRYYGLFNIKWVSNSVYFLMKPLEYFFLLVLYLFDKHPENRIAVQYLSKKDRELIKQKP